MQQCPLCNKEFSKVTKVCPLQHCPNCGSLEIKKQMSRRIKKNYFSAMVVIFFLSGMISLFLFVGVSESYPEYAFLPVLGFFCLMIIFHIMLTIQNFQCLSCGDRNFFPISKIKLKKVKQSLTDKELENNIEYQDKDGLMKKIDTLSETQTRHNKRDLILKVIGIIGSISMGIIGIIINQEGISDFFDNYG